MTSYWVYAWVLTGVIAVVLAGLIVTQRLVPHHRREKHNEIAGYIFAAIGVFYSVLVAFFIVSLWTVNDTVRQDTFKEANDLGTVYWLARNMPNPQGAWIEYDARQYAHVVITSEWAMMAHNQSAEPLDNPGSPVATKFVMDMRVRSFEMKVGTLKDQILFQELTDAVANLESDRRVRLDAAEPGVPLFMWAGLIGGAAIILGFTFVFGLASMRIHAGMVAALAAVVVTSLFMIDALDYPFAGPAMVTSRPFRVLMTRLPVQRPLLVETRHGHRFAVYPGGQ